MITLGSDRSGQPGHTRYRVTVEGEEFAAWALTEPEARHMATEYRREHALKHWIVYGSYAEALVRADSKKRAEELVRESSHARDFKRVCQAEPFELPPEGERVLHVWIE